MECNFPDCKGIPENNFFEIINTNFYLFGEIPSTIKVLFKCGYFLLLLLSLLFHPGSCDCDFKMHKNI